MQQEREKYCHATVSGRDLVVPGFCGGFFRGVGANSVPPIHQRRHSPFKLSKAIRFGADRGGGSGRSEIAIDPSSRNSRRKSCRVSSTERQSLGGPGTANTEERPAIDAESELSCLRRGCLDITNVGSSSSAESISTQTLRQMASLASRGFCRPRSHRSQGPIRCSAGSKQQNSSPMGPMGSRVCGCNPSYI